MTAKKAPTNAARQQIHRDRKKKQLSKLEQLIVRLEKLIAELNKAI